MKPEAAGYLAIARRDLADARQIMGISLANVAARSACFAAFHAAEALIVEVTGRAAKTHRGVRIEFARLTKGNPRVPKAMTTFPAQVYRYKQIGHYSVDPGEVVTMANARDAISWAAGFLDCVHAVLI